MSTPFGENQNERNRPERISMKEVHADLDEFNETKKTVNALLKYKRSLIDLDRQDFDKINEIKSKAINAINNLFDDIINTKKNS